MKGVEWHQVNRAAEDPEKPISKIGIGMLPDRKQAALYTVEYPEEGSPVVTARAYFRSEAEAVETITWLRQYIPTVDDRKRIID